MNATVTAITRAILMLYPPSFRRDAGAAILADVRRRARDLRGSLAGFTWWLLRLMASLLWNAAAAWIETLGRVTSGSVSALDFKLAARLLIRFPGLTATAGLGITLSMVIVVGFFSTYTWYFHPIVPLPDGERLVGLDNRDRATYRVRRSLYDFTIWREQLRSVEDLSAFQTVSRNLIVPGRAVDPVRIAEITPSGFRLARVPAMMGRTLLDSDAAPGATPVLVIGAAAWRTRFDSNPAVLGQTVRLGSTVHTIVGVMPDGFKFPAKHQFWIPLTLRASYQPESADDVIISARLAPGVDADQAQSELAVVAERMAAAQPATHSQLRAEVVPYTYPFAGMSRSSASDLGLINLLFSLVLVAVSGNVAILVYARTATRMGELAVRSALGASRARIVGQLFAESLVLTTIAAGAGLWILAFALDWLDGLECDPNFWQNIALPPSALVYAAALALLTAVMTGVIPALQATGRRLQTNLMHFHSGAGPRLGRTWTSLVVLQIAIAGATVPIITALAWDQFRTLVARPTFAPEEFLAGALTADVPDRIARHRAELSRRLESEPGFAAHSFVRDLPEMEETVGVVIEDNAASIRRDTIASAIDIDLFTTMGVPMLAGRAFGPGDRDNGATDVVIVSRAFADRLLGGHALGRRLQFNERWFEIVGVVENVETNPLNVSLTEPRVYRPMKSRDWAGGHLLIRLQGSSQAAAAGRLREIVASVDPAITVEPAPLDELYKSRRLLVNMAIGGIGAAATSVLLLSAAGIYALMSFTVAQRRREIAIRMALGAQPGQLLRSVFNRAAWQIGTGAAVGVALALFLDSSSDGEALAGLGKRVLPAMTVVIGIVGLLAALGPARRGLRIQPSAALKSD